MFALTYTSHLVNEKNPWFKRHYPLPSIATVWKAIHKQTLLHGNFTTVPALSWEFWSFQKSVLCLKPFPPTDTHANHRLGCTILSCFTPLNNNKGVWHLLCVAKVVKWLCSVIGVVNVKKKKNLSVKKLVYLNRVVYIMLTKVNN